MEGRELAVKRRSLKGITPCEDWYEQDMEVIWENCCACLKGVLSQIEAEKVLGIGITAQGDGLWMIDGRGNLSVPVSVFVMGGRKRRLMPGGRMGFWKKPLTSAAQRFWICNERRDTLDGKKYAGMSGEGGMFFFISRTGCFTK